MRAQVRFVRDLLWNRPFVASILLSNLGDTISQFFSTEDGKEIDPLSEGDKAKDEKKEKKDKKKDEKAEKKKEKEKKEEEKKKEPKKPKIEIVKEDLEMEESRSFSNQTWFTITYCFAPFFLGILYLLTFK